MWTNAGLLLIGPLGKNLSEILIEIKTFPLNEMHLEMSSAKWWPFCLSLMSYRMEKLQAQNWVKFDFEGQGQLPPKQMEL